MKSKTDLYAVLGIERGTSADEIKKAYRKLALEYHPDVNPGDADAEERFKEISVAKEILLSDDKRKLYDEFGLDGVAAGFDPSEARAYQEWARRAKQSPGYESFGAGSYGDQGIEDLLSQLFGARGSPESADAFGRGHDFRSTGRAPTFRGADFETNLEVSFTDAILGNEVQLRIQGREPLRVKLPRGARDGTRIRLKGQGQTAETDAASGDLYIRLHIRPHPFFRRDGDDLHLDVPVTIPELILGAEVQIPTPDGMTTVTVPPRSANGRILRLPERGVAKRASKKSGAANRGHLFIHLQAVLPVDADGEIEEVARKLESLYAKKDPRADIRWETDQ
jgi:curved DNA-binding protein